MTDDQQRMEQVRDAFQYGDEDAREIALAEIITSGPPAQMPLEEYVPYLLWDLTETTNKTFGIRHGLLARPFLKNRSHKYERANMPVISRSVPKALPPEGVAKCQITEIVSGKSSKKGVPYFEFTLVDLGSGLTFKDSLYLSESCAWKVEAACRSAGLSLPDGEYRLVTDDFENRVVYGPIIHKTLPMSGKKVAELNSFWSQEYAEKKNPALAEIENPDNTPEPMTLPAAKAKPDLVKRATKNAPPFEMSDAAALGL